MAVYCLTLDALSDPREQLRRAVAFLEKGTTLWITPLVPPYSLSLVVDPDPMDYSWLRKDLRYVWIGAGSNPQYADQWERLTQHLARLK